ncbi:MAG: hypothetical protein CMF59_08720 [Leptospiraceae bacterium]|nr:hypothetical protein [Leptospiraceae bacterium]
MARKINGKRKYAVMFLLVSFIANCGLFGFPDNEEDPDLATLIALIGGIENSACLLVWSGVEVPGCEVALSGDVTTLAGSGTQGATDGTGIAADFNLPQGMTTDGTSLYVVGTQSHLIRKIVIASGEVTTLAGSGSASYADGNGTAASFNGPHSITSDGKYLYVADTLNNRIRKIDPATMEVTTVAGSGSSSYSDGIGTGAAFSQPHGITCDGKNLYVADTANHRIRKIVIESGVVTTVAGSGASGFSNGSGSSATFDTPYGITTDGTNLYVADRSNHAIRKIVIASREVSTVAGNGSGGHSDGTGAGAQLQYPEDVTTDGTNLFVADRHNHMIRKIVLSTGKVTSIVGSTSSGFADGHGSNARFHYPTGITTDGRDLYVSDHANNRIRKVE